MSANQEKIQAANRVTPSVEFPVTICVLFFADFPNLCQRFFDYLYEFTDPALFQLRVGLNAVSEATRECVRSNQQTRQNISVYEEIENVYKAPLMRRMFHEKPMKTKWMLWFDDDSYPFQGDWLTTLALHIESRQTLGFWGRQMVTDIAPDTEEFIKSAPWYRTVPFVYMTEDSKRLSRPNLFFLEGAYFAGKTEILYQLDWPENRLVQKGDDYILGEALRQNGIETGHCYSGIKINDCYRRGPQPL